MNPLLKQHVETYINDIREENLTNSIVSCPLDVMSDYLDVLRNIHVVVPVSLIPFTRISCYLASVLKNGHMYNITVRSMGDETYEFKFPFSKLDYLQLRKELTACCPYHCVTVDLGTDYNNNCISITVSIQHASMFMF